MLHENLGTDVRHTDIDILKVVYAERGQAFPRKYWIPVFRFWK